MPANLYATLYMLASTFSLSLTGLFSKSLSGTMSTELLALLRLLIPALILLTGAVAFRQFLPARSIIKPIVMRALCIVGCQLCFLKSLEVLSLVEGVVLFATGPLFIPVLEKLFFKVQIKTETKFGLVATFVGVIMLAGDVSGIQLKPELLLGLAAGLFNAGSQVSLFRASKGDMALMSLNGWTFIIASACLVPLIFVTGTSPEDQSLLLSPDEHLWIWGSMLIFSVAVVSNQIFRSKAYQLAESNSQVAPLIYTNLIFTVVWQLTFFDESFSNYQITGIALIIVASLMNSFAAKFLKKASFRIRSI
ncbi:DMT family transporter [Vibrio sp. JC009]|uniref:DMT family transporter n=1 Tax=Vibrio sp. JC009 TaxID=2912314 RepID=UPI0023AF99D3|nr:DMT family transporter [Vibrio sp. JC009]WED24871.1 DMT family transporter [Vibrio sp. JC009]